jgi:hypothetical protein
VGPVPDLLLLRKSGSAGNRTRTSGSVARNSDHYTTDRRPIVMKDRVYICTTLNRYIFLQSCHCKGSRAVCFIE